MERQNSCSKAFLICLLFFGMSICLISIVIKVAELFLKWRDVHQSFDKKIWQQGPAVARLAPWGYITYWGYGVCTTHMGGHFGPKFSKQGSFFGRFSWNRAVYQEISEKYSKMGGFPPKFITKVGMMASLVIRGRYPSENQPASPYSSASHVPPWDWDWFLHVVMPTG